MQCKEWGDANSELFKESHDEAVHKNSYKSRLYELISASLTVSRLKGRPFYGQAMGQLRLTGTFSAECVQRDGKELPPLVL